MIEAPVIAVVPNSCQTDARKDTSLKQLHNKDTLFIFIDRPASINSRLGEAGVPTNHK